MQEGVRLREKGIVTDIAVVTVGPNRAQDQLRTALALGADRAIHVQTDIELQPLIVAKLLAAVARQEAPDLVLLGRQAVDTDNTQTGHILLFKKFWIWLNVCQICCWFRSDAGRPVGLASSYVCFQNRCGHLQASSGHSRGIQAAACVSEPVFMVSTAQSMHMACSCRSMEALRL